MIIIDENGEHSERLAPKENREFIQKLKEIVEEGAKKPKEIERFRWSRTYLLKVKGASTFFFSPKMRNEGSITFVLRRKDNPMEITLSVCVPEGEYREVAGPFEWNGQQACLCADNYIGRGLKGRRTTEGQQQLLVGEEWVDYDKYREALNRMDEEFELGKLH